MKPKIKYINFGIASRQGDTIYMNSKLRNYPMLYNRILLHELSHSNGFLWKDLVIDIKNNHLVGAKKEYYKFIIKNPSTWIEFLPLWIYDRHLAINPFLLGLYGFLLIIGGFLGWLLF